jgi:1-acyl-sn-glycerol-3-phosphate acyltransferase
VLSQQYDIDSIDNRDPAAIERFLPIVESVLQPYFRAEVRGLERVPAGAALYVGNHSAGIMTPDSFLFAAAVYRAHGLDGLPYGLANEVGISLPLVHQLIVPLGAVRASHTAAHALFARGRKALVYPGGEYDAMRPSRHRNRIVFEGRLGYLRLAVREGVPIVPVVTAGGHDTFYVLDDGRWLARLLQTDRLLRIKVWPITLCLPWGLMIGAGLPYFPFRTRILIETLSPIRFERSGEEASRDEAYLRACALRVESLMQSALDRLARERDEG